MKFILKYYFLYLILSSFGINAQNIQNKSNLYNQKSESNLNGPVKSSQVYYSKIDENLPRTYKFFLLNQHNASFYNYAYLELDKNGYGKISIVSLLNKKDKPLNLKAINVDHIEYDSIDIKNKEKYTSFKKKYIRVNDLSLGSEQQ